MYFDAHGFEDAKYKKGSIMDFSLEKPQLEVEFLFKPLLAREKGLDEANIARYCKSLVPVRIWPPAT